MSPLRCEQVLPLLDELALGNLDPRRSPAVHQHLAECAACRQALALTTELFADLSGLAEDIGPLPEGLGDGLTARLLAQLPQLPGTEAPLAGLHRPRVWWPFSGALSVVMGSSAGVAGLTLVSWLTAFWLLPTWATQPVRLLAATAGRVLVAWGETLFFAITLTVRALARAFSDVNPALPVAAALLIAAMALGVALKSPGGRWEPR